MKITPIKIRRIVTGLDTNEAVEKLRISKSMLYKMEQGWQRPGTDLIARMAKLYGGTVDEIYEDLKITG